MSDSNNPRDGDAERPEMTPRSVREIAVEIVDAIYGFTCEFNADPAWHAYVYNVAEERLDAAIRDISSKDAIAFDANVNRLKACEHIADGDNGWEILRHECLSTEAVARLRDARDSALREAKAEIERLREALKAHDEYMLASGYSGPEDRALHPRAAENWARVRIALSEESKQ